MSPSHIGRIIGYSAWACFCMWVGATKPGLGELCAAVMFVGGVTFMETLISCRPGRRVTLILCGTLIVLALSLRCAAKALKWETAAVRGETDTQVVARHMSEERYR